MYEVIYNYKIFKDDTENDEISEETTEETDEETSQIIVELSTQDIDIEYITTEGQYVDNRLYLSTAVSGADNNDIYSMLLSIRNLLVVFILLFVFFKVKNIIHVTLSKLFNKGK